MVLWFKRNTKKLIVLLLFLSFRSHSITKYKKITVLMLNSSCSGISENFRPFRNRRCMWAWFSRTTWILITAFFFNIKKYQTNRWKKKSYELKISKMNEKVSSPDVEPGTFRPLCECSVNWADWTITGRHKCLRELYPPVVVLISWQSIHTVRERSLVELLAEHFFTQFRNF